MTISHTLNNNGYFINNEIWMGITANLPVLYFQIILTNLQNGKTSTQFVSYTDVNNRVSVNLQSIIKSLMSVPNGGTNKGINSSTKVKIAITSNDGTSLEFTKDFIRGGKRTNDINQTISPNQSLRIYEMIPVWPGFPVYDYYLNSDYSISILSTDTLLANLDYRRIKGCSNIYIKFLNQNGGYSYWLFEAWEEKETGDNLGFVKSGTNSLIDLGNTSKSDLQIYSKIPKQYKQYPKDLIVSPDVYAYQNGAWKKIFLKGNSIEFDNIKKVYSVKINLDLNYRYNPSLLWSN